MYMFDGLSGDLQNISTPRIEGRITHKHLLYTVYTVLDRKIMAVFYVFPEVLCGLM
jgi:hypothetical protein